MLAVLATRFKLKTLQKSFCFFFFFEKYFSLLLKHLVGDNNYELNFSL